MMNFLQHTFQTFYLGAAAGDIQGRISSALSTVQSVLTGIVVLVGIVVGLWIVIKRMPSADDPQEKNEVYKAVGRVLGLVAISAALVWVVPWVYTLFQ
jgi:fumarate reductase subunit D